MVREYQTKGTEEENYHTCDISKQSFFCNSLCGYGREKCKYYQDYCEQFVKEDEDGDLF